MRSYLNPLPSSAAGIPSLRLRSAFTLIEMIIVISIISVLLGLLYGALERAQKFSRRTVTFTELKSIESAFKQYQAHYHVWPSNELVAAAQRISSDSDLGFIIDRPLARMLQGVRDTSTEVWKLNYDAVPFLEFSRFSPLTLAPCNPFKSNFNNANDTTRSYKVLFDTDGDRQIRIPGDLNEDTLSPPTNIIASVAVWTLIPATRQTDSSGRVQPDGDVRFGSWETFSAK